MRNVRFIGHSDEGVKESHDGGRGHHFSIHQISQETNLHKLLQIHLWYKVCTHYDNTAELGSLKGMW